MRILTFVSHAIFVLVCSAGAVTNAQTSIQVLGIGGGEGEATEGIVEGITNFSIGPGVGIASSLGRVDPGNQSQLFNLLGNESVRNELRLSDEQYQGVQKIQKAAQQRLSTLISGQIAERRESVAGIARSKLRRYGCAAESGEHRKRAGDLSS